MLVWKMYIDVDPRVLLYFSISQDELPCAWRYPLQSWSIFKLTEQQLGIFLNIFSLEGFSDIT
jgi:hypothetical protein